MQMTDLQPALIYINHCTDKIWEESDCKNCDKLLSHIKDYKDMVYTLLNNQEPVCE